MRNDKRNRKPDNREVKPLNDNELIRLGIRGELCEVNRDEFEKSPVERKKLKELKKAHKQYEASL